ncbi:MAG: hypothetical protein IT579_21820 [Verrucomicrobia subdivision 3 bacterium]|nr:hypothetical protein [Limisphaerales bacterium]
MTAGLSGFQKRGTGCHLTWLLFLVFFVGQMGVAAAEYCAVCKREIRVTLYTWEDKVTHTKRFLCADCVELPGNCYLCSLPVLKDFTTLPDGRVICKRDVSAVILDDTQAAQICAKVKEDLDRQFSRFLALPDTNVTIQLMDRVKLQELFMIIGKDYRCPNAVGCTETKTNNSQRVFEISILSGQPQEEVMTTCVHEFAHTWIIENVPPARARTIGKDAVEGFCELLSYLFAEQQGLATGKSNLLANPYSRGQVHLFIAANRQYGFADIVDWMKSGEDPLLVREDLGRLRRLEELPKTKTTPGTKPNPNVVTPTNLPPRLLAKLALQGITWSKTQPMAIINYHTFGTMEQASVRLASTNQQIRCLEIRTNSVLIQFEDSGVKQELFLPEQ